MTKNNLKIVKTAKNQEAEAKERNSRLAEIYARQIEIRKEKKKR